MHGVGTFEAPDGSKYQVGQVYLSRLLLSVTVTWSGEKLNTTQGASMAIDVPGQFHAAGQMSLPAVAHSLLLHREGIGLNQRV
jgi:hypothetical protein